MHITGKTQKLVFAGLMAALLAITSPFTIPIGPVPLSLSLIWVFFIGFMLRPLPACATILVYILLGVIGLPVFSGFQAGPQVLIGPTGGYIMGYFCIVLVVSHVSKRSKNPILLITAALFGLVACYALGTLWFILISKSSLLSALSLCVFPFVLIDSAKAVLALVLSVQISKRLQKGVFLT